MPNIANIQKLHYCDKKNCPNIATRQVTLKKKEDKDKPTAQSVSGHRCEIHSLTPTASKVVIESNPFDQSYALTMISRFLQSLIGKNIVSKMHTARQLRVKYIKPNTAGVMCYQELSKKYKFVYYEQITEVKNE